MSNRDDRSEIMDRRENLALQERFSRGQKLLIVGLRFGRG